MTRIHLERLADALACAALAALAVAPTVPVVWLILNIEPIL